MNTLPPDESELEMQLRAHFEAQFREQYGEELPATTLWERVEPRLHNPTTRLPMVAERALSPIRERLQGWLRAIGVVGAAREQQGEVAPSAATATQRPTRVRRIATALAPVAAVLVIVGLAAALFLPRLLQQGFPTQGTWQVIPRQTQTGLSDAGQLARYHGADTRSLHFVCGESGCAGADTGVHRQPAGKREREQGGPGVHLAHAGRRRDVGAALAASLHLRLPDRAHTRRAGDVRARRRRFESMGAVGHARSGKHLVADSRGHSGELLWRAGGRLYHVRAADAGRLSRRRALHSGCG